MSEQAKQFLWKELRDEGELEFNPYVERVMDEFDVKRSTAANYIYQYCEWEERSDGKWIVDRAEKYRHQSTLESGIDDGDDDEESAEVMVRDMDQPVPDKTGEVWNGLDVVESGHPLVPDVREYLTRKLDNDSLGFDLGDNVKDTEALCRAVGVDDYGVVLIGEPGTGKGHLIKYVFSQANRPLVRVNFGSRITKEKLVGGFVPKGNGDELDDLLDRAQEMADDRDDLSTADVLEVMGQRDKFEWKDGLLTKAVRYGWGFNADELNAAAAETLMPLFGLLEDGDSRTLELTEKGEVVQPHPEFKFIATMNPPHHAGTQELNDALIRRLIPITIPYLDAAREEKLLESRTGVSSDDASTLVELAQGIRERYPNDIATTCTPSELEQIAYMGETMGLEAAAKMVLLSPAVTETDKDSLKRRIDLAFD